MLAIRRLDNTIDLSRLVIDNERDAFDDILAEYPLKTGVGTFEAP